MDWQKGRQSDNVEDGGGDGGGGLGGGGMRFGGFHLGVGGIILVVVIGLVFPSLRPILFGLFLGDSSTNSSVQSTPATPAKPLDNNDPQVKFVRSILGSTEDVWGSYFQASGQQYEQPKLLLFHGQTRSGCGAASESMGPFYCPTDHRVYLDLDFFHEMDTRFHASGDFARAYVIAHEVGHHVQNQLGVMKQEETAQRQGQSMEGAAGLSVRLELQADCFAGVWGNRSQAQLNWLQAGDVDAALNAAAQVGGRHLAEAGAWLRCAGFVYSRDLGATCALVQGGVCFRRHQELRYVRRSDTVACERGDLDWIAAHKAQQIRLNQSGSTTECSAAITCVLANSLASGR